MGATFVIALREGIEAALIVSILLAYLRQLGRGDRARVVWWGAGLATLASVVVGTTIFLLGAEFDGTAEEIFEGLVTLLAVAVLTWMIFWMRRQGAGIRAELHDRVDSALLGAGAGLAAIAFFSVLREGIETALFLFAAAEGTAASDGGVGAQLVGAVLGLALAIAIGVLLYRGAIRMNLRTFFRITGFVLIVIAAGLFAAGIHELQAAGWFPFLEGTAFDVTSSLPDDSGIGAILRGLIGYNADPSTLEVVAWFGYLLVVGTLYLRPVAATEPSRAAVADGSSES
ncbi:MAG TPA: iron uptake transporter permease EfeU [Actinomycetota bacterium]|nr:iron uptake transporter permease EfeU [Actinomycetota bacterium]